MSYVAKGKRVVRLADGNVADLGDMYLTDFIQPDSLGATRLYGYGWEWFAKDYQSNPDDVRSLVNLIGIDSVVIKEIWNWSNVNIQYRYDSKYFDVADFWQIPSETMTMLRGDCEDTTFLLTSAIIHEVENAFESSFKGDVVIYGCIGYYIDSNGNYFGHGFPIMRNKRVNPDLWLWLESTLDFKVPLGVWYGVNFNTLLPVYFANHKESYRIDKDYMKLGLSKDYVQQYEDYINDMIEYVESGKKLSVKWMHKGKRVPDLGRTIKIDILNEVVM